MAPPCRHGWEKVQDNDGRVKTGASDGWKEFMRAPTEVREENSFLYTCLKKRESGEIVPLLCSPHQEDGLIFDSVQSGPAVLTNSIGQKGKAGWQLHEAH